MTVMFLKRKEEDMSKWSQHITEIIIQDSEKTAPKKEAENAKKKTAARKQRLQRKQLQRNN